MNTTMTRLPTRSGLELAVRPATEDDEQALADFFDKVSDEDRRFRFLTAAQHLSHAQLDPLIHADHFRSESFLAFDAATDELIASALLACDNKMDTAEIAISIRQDYRGKGAAWALLDMLGQEAERRGARCVCSIESRDNHAAIDLEREKGFVPSSVEGEPALVMLTKTFR